MERLGRAKGDRPQEDKDALLRVERISHKVCLELKKSLICNLPHFLIFPKSISQHLTMLVSFLVMSFPLFFCGKIACYIVDPAQLSSVF